MKIYINPLSANSQFHTDKEVLDAMRRIVECLNFCIPAIDTTELELFYDSRLENRRLQNERTFCQSLNHLSFTKKDADVRRLWFLFTKNRAKLLSSIDGCEVVARRTIGKSFVKCVGEIHSSMITHQRHWLSLSGDQLFDSVNFDICSGEGKVVTVSNITSVSGLERLLPSYEPNLKHRKEAYISKGGEFVSAMPLSKDAAQDLLMRSYVHKKDRWAFHSESCTYFRFKRTHPDFEIFHGFVADSKDVPLSLRPKLNR